MNNNTRVVVILDQSQSMDKIKNEAITGFNEFVETLKQQPGDCTLKLVAFNDTASLIYDLPLNQVPALSTQTFKPSGNTALHDTQYTTVEHLGTELSKMPEQERPNRVVVCVITDGQENASRTYTNGQVHDQTVQQREKYNWEYMLIGSNQDAIKTAQGLGIPERAALTIDNTPQGFTRGIIGAANFINSYRAASDSQLATNSMAFTVEDRKASVGQIPYGTGVTSSSLPSTGTGTNPGGGSWSGQTGQKPNQSQAPNQGQQDGNTTETTEPVPYASA